MIRWLIMLNLEVLTVCKLSDTKFLSPLYHLFNGLGSRVVLSLILSIWLSLLLSSLSLRICCVSACKSKVSRLSVCFRFTTELHWERLYISSSSRKLYHDIIWVKLFHYHCSIFICLFLDVWQIVGGWTKVDDLGNTQKDRQDYTYITYQKKITPILNFSYFLDIIWQIIYIIVITTIILRKK